MFHSFPLAKGILKEASLMDLTEVTKFAARYAKAWCSQDPETVAAFYAEHGSLSVNGGPPAVSVWRSSLMFFSATTLLTSLRSRKSD